MSLYLSRIEGSPPKRNAPGSNPGRDIKKGVDFVDTLRQNQDFDELGQKNKARFLRARFALQILEIWAFPRRK